MTTREQAIEAAERACESVASEYDGDTETARRCAKAVAAAIAAIPPPPPSDAGERDRALVREATRLAFAPALNGTYGGVPFIERVIATVNATHPPDTALAQMTAERDALEATVRALRERA